MYFVAYLVVGFHSHLHLSSFNINTNIHMKGEYKAVPSLYKRGKAFIFCKMNVLNKKLLFFWLLSQYTWSEILNKDNYMYHNPFPWGWHPLAYCLPPYFCLVYCVPPCFGLAHCVPFNNKTTIFGNFIYIKKIKWQYVACTCTIILANVKFGVFAC